MEKNTLDFERKGKRYLSIYIYNKNITGLNRLVGTSNILFRKF